ncbi:alanine--tRNA ligase [Candidatus Epulonipiscium fishelsonii]|uniref:Alanine--tRNA ligase n=1 Tax=Candidatus Epulonipiscium fishelsonii TaxID=77094 RepID=A0ACC8XA93_9FIRM|nr:alanine--tRNA ligase [Epulopiscium sp. SCG-B11WGA-EpuloA1]ONI43508.1 alanine--tRNA ligase [Epulopiscium sp. SCG-B05WGA-EpuloA1]
MYGLNELREMYLSFFQSKGHLRLKSFSLLPNNDKSLLLINAGMAPLKPYFTGQEVPPSKRVTTCQKCIRTGDIDNVGKTARHGTFFEMLGNFSFGDYFKEEAIEYAWEFLTKVINISPEKLSVSVYEEDEEAAQIWHNKIGIPKEKIFYMGKEDNFWEVGTVGPCGPCSEIYYDRGEKYGCGSPNCAVGCDCDRFLEIWNLVFTQFDKQEDGSYAPLPKPNIDTGMGLERLAVVMQDVYSLFDVDTVKNIRDHVCKMANVTYGKNLKKDISIRVITDHVRAITFLASDGVRASNEGTGYILRRLLRRAVRHGKLLGIKGLFLEPLIKTVVENSKHEYSELQEKFEYIIKALTVEEKNFNLTIEQGLNILEEYISDLQKENKTILDGAKCFKLYDTYGFPLDLTLEILEEKGLGVDEEGFKREMEAQRNRARSAQAETNYMGADRTIFHELDTSINSIFNGYDKYDFNSEIKFITTQDKIIESAKLGENIFIITEQTPFYAESGGQIGDIGEISTDTGVVKVTATTKVVGGKIAHQGEVIKGEIKVNQPAHLDVDKKNRLSIMRNHSATHLLQHALREIVGTHIEQAGSNVTADRLRFDYTHFQPLSSEQIREIENLVNNEILNGYAVTIEEMSIDEARKKGAMALFGEKYSEVVRVVDMGKKSIELCGGTHVTNTTEIGTFKIVSEIGVASGVRRIEAITGFAALSYYQNLEDELNQIGDLVKARKNDIVKKVTSNLKELQSLQKDFDALKSQIARSEATQILDNATEVNGLKILVAQLENIDMNNLRDMGDTLKDKLGEGIIFLASGNEGKVNLVCMATKGAVEKGAHCGNIISKSAKIVDGGGGGRPNMAQAGGKNYNKIKECLKVAKEIILEQIK